jgi:phosphoglycolate phosphatase-like HAD superfamily hydrolase
MTSPGVLLDIDGTLADTNYLHVLAWVRAFRRHGHDVAMVDVHQRIGMGGDRLVEGLIGGSSDEVEQAWAEEYHHLQPEVRLLPGARRLVEAIAATGASVVLASSAPSGDVDHARQLLDLERCLTGATSSDDAEASKPSSDIFDAALVRHGLDRSVSWVVGDSVWDADAARSAGLAFVGVETGGTLAASLLERGAVEVFAGPDALAAAVESGAAFAVGEQG